MTQSTKAQLWGLFADMCEQAAASRESEQGIAQALNDLVRELSREPPFQPDQTLPEMKGMDKMRCGRSLSACPAINGLVGYFGVTLSQSDLVRIAMRLQQLLPNCLTPLSRNQKRDPAELRHWYNLNWGTIQPHLSRVGFTALPHTTAA